MQPLRTSEPSRVGDYRLLARIGGGSMGAVYLARSRGGRIVAIKVVRPDLAEDGEFRERFRREVQMARSVGALWTAAVVGADPDAEQPWLATEYVPGPTLHQAVVEHGPLPERTVRGLGAGLAEALTAIHRAGLVHRDLKPGNVLLGPDGPRVIDFGISRAMSGNALTATGMFLGTPGFFSPEQTIGTEIGPPSDVFSLGAVLVFACTGSGPFGTESTATMLYRVVHTEPDLSQVPQSLRGLLGATLAKDPAARPTPGTLLDQLGEPSPRGESWLPPSITAVINEHTTQLQRTTEQAPPDTPAPAPQPNRSYTPAQPAAPAAPRRIPPAEPAADPQPAGSKERTNKITPVRPKGTSAQPISPARVRKDDPGPVFATGGRSAALFSAVAAAALIVGVYVLSQRLGASVDVPVFVIGALLLGTSCALSLAKVVLPGLRLKVNSDGMIVSRAGLTREVPWSQVSRVGVAGRGKKLAVIVWSHDGFGPLRSRLWHRTTAYHGGARLFPIGATGGWLTRRRELRRVRSALHQYAPGSYDDRML